jgi:hypothetical protein
MTKISRRSFLQNSGVLIAGATAAMPLLTGTLCASSVQQPIIETSPVLYDRVSLHTIPHVSYWYNQFAKRSEQGAQDLLCIMEQGIRDQFGIDPNLSCVYTRFLVGLPYIHDIRRVYFAVFYNSEYKAHDEDVSRYVTKTYNNGNNVFIKARFQPKRIDLDYGLTREDIDRIAAGSATWYGEFYEPRNGGVSCDRVHAE